MKTLIIPAILAQRADEARSRIERVQSAAQWIQLDVADGKLVPNKTWHDARAFRSWKIRPNVELHLMTKDPAAIIKSWRPVPNFKRAVWHVEAPIDHDKLIAGCRRARLECGLALFPETPVSALVPYLRKIDTALVLGVHPGFSGQKLIASTRKKIDELHRLAPHLPIEFDGGVNKRSALSLAARGVARICLASAVFQSQNPEAFVNSLQNRLNSVH